MNNFTDKVKNKVFYNSDNYYNEPIISMEQINFDVSETTLGADICNEEETKYSNYKTNFSMYNNEPYPLSKPKNQKINVNKNFNINFMVEEVNYKNVITIQNLPKIISERKIREIFSQFGNILSLYVNIIFTFRETKPMLRFLICS